MKRFLAFIVLSFFVIASFLIYRDFFQKNFSYEVLDFKVVEEKVETPYSAIKYLQETIGLKNVSINSLYDKSFTTYTAKSKSGVHHYIITISGIVPSNSWDMKVKKVLQQKTDFSGRTVLVLDSPKETNTGKASYIQSLLNHNKNQSFVVKIIEVIEPKYSMYDTSKVTVVENKNIMVNEKYEAIEYNTGKMLKEVNFETMETNKELFVMINDWLSRQIELLK